MRISLALVAVTVTVADAVAVAVAVAVVVAVICTGCASSRAGASTAPTGVLRSGYLVDTG